FFGEISLIAPLTNLLTVWAAAALLYLACATLLLSALGLSVLVSALSVPMTAIARFLTWVTRALSGVWGAVWNTRSLYIQVWIIGGLLLLWLGWRLCKGRGLRIAAAMCVIALCAGTLLYTVRMRGVTTLVAYNRYEQTAVAALRDGHAIVIVSGRSQSWKSAARLLDGQGVSAVDAVIITDPARFSADEWAAFDARLEVGRYWLTELEPDAAACLMNGGAPVSVAAWNGKQSVSLWQDGAWRWVRTSGILLFRFGETRLRIGNRAFFDDGPDDSENSAARRMLSVSMADRVTGQCDDTPYPGQRPVWYTRGQGVWVR
ncbi:MAG: hypothetical protein IKI63_01005, partial [Clostridia bacterium]|nr:hypothetical protein [Clostridia bacterium]